MAEPEFGRHLSELRRAYIHATLRQRARAARDRMAYPEAAPNRLIAAVSATEALARAMLLETDIENGTAPAVAYKKLKDVNAIKLAERIVSPKTGDFLLGTIGKLEWSRFKWAVEYRNLLIHEGTFLRQGYANTLIQATRKVFNALESST